MAFCNSAHCKFYRRCQKGLQCALFKGVGRDEFIDKKEFRGPIQSQVEVAYRFVLRHINRSAMIDGLYRHDSYELPTKSIREVIANACLHRSYLDSSAIQVSIYDDRIEVDSPGMLYDGLNVTEALSGKSKCRNKAIAEAFQYMKIIEGWGTGLPRLFLQCKEMGLPAPRFEEFGDGIKVTIYRAIGDTQSGTNDTNNIKAGTDGTLSETEQKIIELLKADGKATQKKLAEELGISLRTVKRNMTALQEKGTIARVGSNKAGYWKVNTESLARNHFAD